MSSITNLVPIRVDASSSDGAVRIVDTLLLDTTCLPVAHAHPHHDGNPSSGLSTLSGASGSAGGMDMFSLSSLVDANAAHLTESILADSEVQGSARSSSRTFMGGRLDLLGDAKLYRTIEGQIRTQLGIALNADKKDLMLSGGSIPVGAAAAHPTPDGAVSSDGKVQSSSEAAKVESRIVRIKIRLRHENIVVVDEFDYDINSSGMEGCDPFSIANSLVEDMKLPQELAPSIAATIVEQIYGVDVSASLDGFTSNSAIRGAPTAMTIDPTKDGSYTDYAQVMMNG